VAGSLVMIAGALAVSTAIATEREHASTNEALLRECTRYGLNYGRVLKDYNGSDEGTDRGNNQRCWWDYAILAAAVGVFVYLGVNARPPELGMNMGWLWALGAVLLATAAVCGWTLGKATRFS
jgi:hypothetical protein